MKQHITQKANDTIFTYVKVNALFGECECKGVGVTFLCPKAKMSELFFFFTTTFKRFTKWFQSNINYFGYFFFGSCWPSAEGMNIRNGRKVLIHVCVCVCDRIKVVNVHYAHTTHILYANQKCIHPYISSLLTKMPVKPVKWSFFYTYIFFYSPVCLEPGRYAPYSTSPTHINTPFYAHKVKWKIRGSKRHRVYILYICTGYLSTSNNM